MFKSAVEDDRQRIHLFTDGFDTGARIVKTYIYWPKLRCPLKEVLHAAWNYSQAFA
jgi:hypothetical protein